VRRGGGEPHLVKLLLEPYLLWRCLLCRCLLWLYRGGGEAHLVKLLLELLGGALGVDEDDGLAGHLVRIRVGVRIRVRIRKV
jgi:hypothetical protein